MDYNKGVLKHLFSYLSKNQFVAVLFLVAAAFFVFLLKDILLIIFIAYIVVAALNPIVNFLKQKGIPNTIAVLLTFFTTVLFFFLLIAPLVPFFVSQILQLSKSFPIYLHQAATAIGLQVDVRDFGQIFSAQQIGSNAFALAGGVFGGFFSVVTTIAISFYLLLYYDAAKKNVARLFPQKHQNTAILMIDQVNNKLGAWLQGQFLLSISIGLITWIILTLLQMPFALPLAVLAGLFEIVPTVGPIIAAVPAIIVAFTISPNMALFIILAYIFIQLLENHLLVPRIMQRAVGLNPIVVIIGVIVGDRLLGIPGALLSVPFISLVVLVSKNLDTLLNKRQLTS